jgi:hypothetical protein
VKAHREARGHARELERRAQERLAQVRAVGRVVPALAVVGEPDGAQRPFPVHELGCEHAARTQRPALMVEHLVEDREPVAAPQVAMEVDVAGEDVGDLHRHAVRQPHVVRGGEERRADLALLQVDAADKLGGLVDDTEALAVPREAEDRGFARDEPQLEELTEVARARVHRHAGAEAAERLRPPVLFEEQHRVGAVDAELVEQRRERVAALEPGLVPVGLDGVGGRIGELEDERLDDRLSHDDLLAVAGGAECGHTDEEGGRADGERRPALERQVARGLRLRYHLYLPPTPSSLFLLALHRGV